MADLSGIFNPAGYDMATPALKAFGQMAEVNLAKQKLKQNAEFKLLDLDMERKKLAVMSQGKTTLETARNLDILKKAQALGDYGIGQREELTYEQSKAALFQAGVGSLEVRLDDPDPEVRKEAAEELAVLDDQFYNSKSANVKKSIGYLRTLKGASERAQGIADRYDRTDADRDASRKGVADRYDRTDADRDASRKLAQDRLTETQRHNKVMEASKAKNASAAGDLKLTVKGFGRMSLDDIRRTLARGGSNADELRMGLKGTSRGEPVANADIGKMVAPTYDDEAIGRLLIQGRSLLEENTDPVTPAEEASVLPPMLGEDQVPPKITSKTQFDALPAGSLYTGKDGKTYRKP